MAEYETDCVFDETPVEAERAILKGLRYLEREALGMKLGSLARIIRRAVKSYDRLMGDQRDGAIGKKH